MPGQKLPSEFSRNIIIKTFSLHYYDVVNSDYKNLRHDILNSTCPKDLFNIPRYAVTKWSTKWKWDLDQNDKVVPHTIKVLTFSTVTIPKVIKSNWSKADNLSYINTFDKLLYHELNHIRAHKYFSFLIEKKLKDMANKGITDPHKFNLIASKLIKKNNSWDIQYDLDSSNGKTEGVDFG